MPISAPLTLGLQARMVGLGFYVGSADLNSGPLDYMASTFIH